MRGGKQELVLSRKQAPALSFFSSFPQVLDKFYDQQEAALRGTELFETVGNVGLESFLPFGVKFKSLGC